MKKNKLLLLALSSSFILLTNSLNSLAQTLPLGAGSQLPQNINPGAIAQPRTYRDQTKLKTAPKDVIKDQEPEKEAPQDDTQEQKTKILLKEIIVLDNSVVPPYEVSKITKKYKNREVDFNELQELTDELTNLYKEKGYVTSRFYLPPQKIEDGILTVQSSEGIIKPISLQEGKYFKSRAIFPRLQIDQNEKLDIDDIKKDLARINENPDIGLQAVLKPGKETGQTELLLQSNDRFPVHFSPFLDNLGRSTIGNNRLGFGVTHNNVLGFGDRDVATLNWSDSSFGVSNNYEIPIGKYGTKFGFNFAHSRLKLGQQFAPLDIKGLATIYSPYISQELYRGKYVQASADVALDFKDLSTDIFDGSPAEQRLNVDRLRVLRPGINIDQFDKYGRTFMRHELGIGLDALGATDSANPLTSRAGSKPDFFRYTTYLTRITQLPWGIQDVFRVTGQVSPHYLNSAEQIQMGGAFTVRGYKEGQFIGDSGYILSNEVRFPFYIFPKSAKFKMTANGIPMVLSRKGPNQPLYDYVFRDNIQLVAFTDFGQTFTNISRAPRIYRANNAITDTALSAGVGLRVRLTRFLVGRVDVGFPLLGDKNVTNNHFVHFGLQSEAF
ncbi:MAG: ShlB/FhaC/HecB family hemolysin secretion/activation protein [Candidatus Caenarcaniphilales bacterium]|nr:ShlB/FhaC/HecB family hemolysin secretion/activation protein [Candidatus Caenarcaniphilales bacterium]